MDRMLGDRMQNHPLPATNCGLRASLIAPLKLNCPHWKNQDNFTCPGGRMGENLPGAPTLTHYCLNPAGCVCRLQRALLCVVSWECRLNSNPSHQGHLQKVISQALEAGKGI